MTTIQELLFEMESSYYGHPYFVSGHALFSAIAQNVDRETARTLAVSTGVFVPGEYGKRPRAAAGAGRASFHATSLDPVETYGDLFVFRDAAHRWLHDTRPRDAHNTLDIQSHSGRLTFAPTCRFGKPPSNHYTKRSVRWHVHCYLHAGGSGRLPLSEGVLDGIQVGGGRNYGFGELRLVDSQTVDIDDIDYSRLKTQDDTGGFDIELCSPYVVATEYPEADDNRVPWWWETSETGAGSLRRRQTQLVEGEHTYNVELVDHGQIVGYAGSDPIRTAKNGILRVGTHSKFGFGEFRLRPAADDRVIHSDTEIGARCSTDRPREVDS